MTIYSFDESFYCLSKIFSYCFSHTWFLMHRSFHGSQHNNENSQFWRFSLIRSEYLSCSSLTCSINTHIFTWNSLHDTTNIHKFCILIVMRCKIFLQNLDWSERIHAKKSDFWEISRRVKSTLYHFLVYCFRASKPIPELAQIIHIFFILIVIIFFLYIITDFFSLELLSYILVFVLLFLYFFVFFELLRVVL